MSSVVVTGAASGIGHAIAVRLFEMGWSLSLVDNDPNRLREVQKELQSFQPKSPTQEVSIVIGDISDPSTHAQAGSHAESLGGLMGWVNCAGITVQNSLNEISVETSRRIVDVNQMGTLWGTSEALTRMIRNKTSGSIVNISSVHGRLAYPDYAVYEMTKAAIDALTRNAAVAYGPFGIRVNAVAPGAVMTDALAASLASAKSSAAATAELESRNALGRIARPAEIASVVGFLLSDDASYLTGQSIAVDGGWTATLGRNSKNDDANRMSGGSENVL
ncbi:MAG TPA: SDR family oxidoreductase [Acidimicrobiales bacterium]|nr:SDR family oxidoreductase [Acidimicrobiales bacterium]